MGSLALGNAINSFMQGAMDFLRIYQGFQKLKQENELAQKRIELQQQELQQNYDLRQQQLNWEKEYQNQLLQLKKEQQEMAKKYKDAQLQLMKNQSALIDIKKKLANLQLKDYPQEQQYKREMEKLKAQTLKLQYENAKIQKQILAQKLNIQPGFDLDNAMKLSKFHMETAKNLLKILQEHLYPDRPDAVMKLMNNPNDINLVQKTIGQKIIEFSSRKDISPSEKMYIKKIYHDYLESVSNALKWQELLKIYSESQVNQNPQPQPQPEPANPNPQPEQKPQLQNPFLKRLIEQGE